MNSQLLQHYIRLVSFLGGALGPDYEVALHDLSDPDKSIAAIANGNISGREIGAPLTNKALRFLADNTFSERDYVLHYQGISKNGKLLRSNTMFIKDADGTLIGLLCINFDDSRFNELCSRVLKLCHPDDFVDKHVIPNTISAIWSAEFDSNQTEEFPNTVDGVIDSVIQHIALEFPAPIDRLTQDEKLIILDRLNQQGVFRIKGSVSRVAKALSSSEASIYRYLGKLNRGK